MLLKGFDVWYLAASAIGFVAGATNGFLLNRRWTFRGHVGDALTPRALGDRAELRASPSTRGCCSVLVHDARLDELVAQAFATAVVTTLTFFANRAWTFRMHAHDHAARRRRGRRSAIRAAAAAPPQRPARGRLAEHRQQ